MRSIMKLFVLGGTLAGLALASHAAAGSVDDTVSKNRRADRPRMERPRDRDAAWNLTDAQREKMKAFRKSFQKEMEPLRKKIQKDEKTVVDKLKSGGTDEQLKPLLDRLTTDREAMRAQVREQHQAMRSLLTPTQQARLLMKRLEHKQRSNRRKGDKGVECERGMGGDGWDSRRTGEGSSMGPGPRWMEPSEDD